MEILTGIGLEKKFIDEADKMFGVLKMVKKDGVHGVSNDDLLIISENHKEKAAEMYRLNNEYVDITGNRHSDYDKFVTCSTEVGIFYDKEIALRKEMLDDFDGKVW